MLYTDWWGEGVKTAVNISTMHRLRGIFHRYFSTLQVGGVWVEGVLWKVDVPQAGRRGETYQCCICWIGRLGHGGVVREISMLHRWMGEVEISTLHRLVQGEGQERGRGRLTWHVAESIERTDGELGRGLDDGVGGGGDLGLWHCFLN